MEEGPGSGLILSSCSVSLFARSILGPLSRPLKPLKETASSLELSFVYSEEQLEDVRLLTLS